MGSIVFNPSTQQPESVSVKTGSYTIPVGYYAYVTASVQGSDTFSIGGVVALQGVAASASVGTGGNANEIDVSATNTTAIYTYTVPVTYYFYYNAFIAGYPASGTYEIETYINSQSTSSGYNVAYRSSTSGTFVYSPSVAVGGGVAAVVNGIIVHEQQGPYGPGTIIGVDVNNTSSLIKRISGTLFRPNTINSGQAASAVSGSFWVPQNTVLTTSSGSYTVSLYKNVA